MKYDRLQWINSAPVLHDQLLSAFIHAYIPAPRNPYGHFDSDYMCLLPRRLGKSPLLDCGTIALCSAYIGQIHHDTELRKYGLQKYIEAVKGMRKRLPQLRSKEEFLYLISVLQTYEVRACHDPFRILQADHAVIIEFCPFSGRDRRLECTCAGMQSHNISRRYSFRARHAK